MKQYVTVAKGIYEPHDWFVLGDEINANDCPFKTKKIHIKHKHILDAYMKDNNIKIEELISDKPNEHWQNIQDGYTGVGKNFIDLYTEDTEYRLKQKEKPKNNFKDYGFEADFDGEICFLNEEDDYYIGYIIENRKKILMQWDKSGLAYNSNDFNVVYCDLKPIKKEWYEKEDNFRIAVKQIKCFTDYIDRVGDVCIMEKITDNKGISSYSTNGYHTPLQWLECYRPATKEEVLSLLVKE